MLLINCQSESDIVGAHYSSSGIVIIERLDKVVNGTLTFRLRFQCQNSQRQILPS